MKENEKKEEKKELGKRRGRGKETINEESMGEGEKKC